MGAPATQATLRVLKIFHSFAALTREIFFFNKRRETSYLQAAMLCSIYYINTNELPNHFTLIVFWCERRDLLCSHSNGDIFTREDNMLFSQVKISSFRAKAHLVFHWCLYNKVIYLTIIPRVCVGFGYNHLISNITRASGIIVLLKTLSGEFFFFNTMLVIRR